MRARQRFSIADGILPSNEGRNYVIRKIMRRAIYQGRHSLGLEGLFFHKVTNFVIDEMGEAYPELESHRDFIDKMVRLEKSGFGSTLTVGLQKLDELFAKTAKGKAPEYKELARLYDTFGTPRDLIRVSLEERGVQIGEEEFIEQFDAALQQLQQGSSIGKTEQKTKTKPIYAEVAGRVQSLFRGYETTRVDDAKVLSIISGDQEVQELKAGEDGGIVLDQTPYYAESGGQVGDVGILLEVARASRP
jgi:alanyl-tRNA synthetase